MLKRISLATISILILPWLVGQPTIVQNTNSQAVAFISIAYAGHTNPSGEACTCGCSGCICDPGETRQACTNGMTPGADQSKKPTGSTPDLGSAGLIFVLAVFAWLRLR